MFGYDEPTHMMGPGFRTFRFNDVYQSDGGHTLAFDTYDRPTLDDLNIFAGWLDDSDLLLRCSITRLIPLVRDGQPFGPGDREYFPKAAFLRVEISGILIERED